MDAFTSRAVLLRKIEYGEADNIITFFTEEKGKVKAFARKAKKSKKRFGTSLDLLAFVKAELSPPKKGAAFHSLNSVSTFKPYENIRKDLKLIAMGNYMLELFSEMTPENERNDDLFKFLINFLDLLDGGNFKVPSFYLFVIKFLRLIGFGPQTRECVKCKRKYDNQKWHFRVDKGGILCRECLSEDRRPGIVLSPETINLLKRESENPLNFVKRVLPSKKASVELAIVTDRFIYFYLGKKLNSAKFLEEIDAKIM